MMASPVRRTDAVLDRLTALHPKKIDLGLERTHRLLCQLGNPEKHMPPVIHVAGTNGKGSCIAFMRAIAEAAGLTVHAYTSPHLVSFNERINLRGKPIQEDKLLDTLRECEAANKSLPITFFEITTAAAFLAFSRSPADLLLVETGLGGRFDSTNVIERPSTTVITTVSLDHTSFLGPTVEKIAFEKAGIIKSKVPCVVGPQTTPAIEVIINRAKELGAPVMVFGREWFIESTNRQSIVYSDVSGEIKLPAPGLSGKHQIYNAGVAVAAMRLNNAVNPTLKDFSVGVAGAIWPGRLQQLTHGKLSEVVATGLEVWIDGGHNPAAADALAKAMEEWDNKPVLLICALQDNKDIKGFLTPLIPVCSGIIAINLPGKSPGHFPKKIADAASKLGARSTIAKSLVEALKLANSFPVSRILICGSLFLAGEALFLNGDR